MPGFDLQGAGRGFNVQAPKRMGLTDLASNADIRQPVVNNGGVAPMQPMGAPVRPSPIQPTQTQGQKFTAGFEPLAQMLRDAYGVNI